MPSSEGDTLLPPRAVRRHAGASRMQRVQRVSACDGNYEDDRGFDICDICDDVGDGDLLFAAMLARLACRACNVSRLVIVIVMLVVMLIVMLVMVKYF